MTRPEPQFPPPDDCHFQAWADPDWKYDPNSGRDCRQPTCREPAIAAYNRRRRTAEGRRDSWWYYCADHLYGRWIEDGKVFAWRLGLDAPYVNGVYRHYWSTYCIHELHDACRLSCKHCKAPCQCPCHLGKQR